MRRYRVRLSPILLGVCALSVALPPDAARAQWTVIDPSNLAQNIQQVAQSLEQINNQRLQIEYQLQSLRKLDRVHWRDIRGLVQQLDLVMQRQRAIAYSLGDLNRQFHETFPGWQAAPDNLTFAAAQRDQAERTLGTMGAGLNVLNEHARQLGNSQATLAAIKEQMQEIDGTQEALELQASLDAFLVEEIGLLRQTVSTAANVQAVYNAYQVNQEVEMRANYRAMLDRMAGPLPKSQRTFSLMVEPW